MKKFNLFILTLALSWPLSMNAQQGPYLEPLYDVQVTLDQEYAVNTTILPIFFLDEAWPRPLLMDIYEPVGDENGPRPVVLVFHTGNFLPFPQNGDTGGTIRDSTVVETCTRLAQRGYVAAAIDYRLGWNPVDPSELIRRFFFVNAVYRTMQDARTAVRFMRKSAVDEGNPYNIDPDRIGLWGINTGGYIAAATAAFDEYSEIEVPNFLIDLGDGPVPMVIEAINGDINGTSTGITPPGYPAINSGVTLCYPNHVTYNDGSPISSDINVVVNNGGAILDINWIDENTTPWISFHVPTDPDDPYNTGVYTISGTGNPDEPIDDFLVVEVFGSYAIQTALQNLGTNNPNAIFANIPEETIDYSEVANSRNDGLEGLFPFPSEDSTVSAPWDFYAANNANVPPNPPPNPELARTYWDTIFAYAGPRLCEALDLNCDYTPVDVGVNELNANEIGLSILPNPASSVVVVSANADYTLKTIEMYDANGHLARKLFNINSNQMTIDRKGVPAGIYFLRLRFEEGVAIQKFVFK